MTPEEALSALGLDRGASPEQVKAAYREAVFWCHPDKNPGNRVAEVTFKRVAEAYELLAKDGSGRRWDDTAAAREHSTRPVAQARATSDEEAANRRADEERARIRAAVARKAYCVRCGKFRALIVAQSKRRVCGSCVEAENVPDSVVRADLGRLRDKLKELAALAKDPTNLPPREPTESAVVEGGGGTSAFFDDEEYWFWEEAPGSWAQAEVVGGERKVIKRGCPTKEEAMRYYRNHKLKEGLRKVISYCWVEGQVPGLGKAYVTHDWRMLVTRTPRKGWSLRDRWSLFLILHGELGLVGNEFPTAEAAMTKAG